MNLNKGSNTINLQIKTTQIPIIQVSYLINLKKKIFKWKNIIQESLTISEKGRGILYLNELFLVYFLV